MAHVSFTTSADLEGELAASGSRQHDVRSTGPLPGLSLLGCVEMHGFTSNHQYRGLSVRDRAGMSAPTVITV
jgi:hypothetical protein